MNSQVTTVAAGRPREFDMDAALAAALRVFSARGYAGASMSELTAVMGIKRPSLYAAFGNKEALFRKALDLYERDRTAVMNHALQAPTSRDVAERVLYGALGLQCSQNGSSGCLHVTHSVACGTDAEFAKREVIGRNACAEAMLLQRFERAKNENDLPAGVEPLGLVRYLVAIMQGMAIQASSGIPREGLERLVQTALLIWPGRSSQVSD